jgi:hypothetical protein
VQITVAARFKARRVFARSNVGIVGSYSTRGMDVCARLFCVQVAALRRADPPSKESDCVQDQETERTTKVQQRAAQP